MMIQYLMGLYMQRRGIATTVELKKLFCFQQFAERWKMEQFRQKKKEAEVK